MNTDPINPECLQRLLQAEYDKWHNKYARGCNGCYAGKLAIAGFAKEIGLPIQEKK